MQKNVWCSLCSTLFGKESDGVLTIKHRDLYRSFEGGRVYGPCRGCGTIVEWPRKAKDIG